jgi:hypothetical protein
MDDDGAGDFISTGLEAGGWGSRTNEVIDLFTEEGGVSGAVKGGAIAGTVMGGIAGAAALGLGIAVAPVAIAFGGAALIVGAIRGSKKKDLYGD